MSSFNEHNVTPVKNGSRCAIYVSMTTDKQFANVDYWQAINLLRYPTSRMLRKSATMFQSVEESTEAYRARVVGDYARRGVELSDLGVWDRLKVDGLASQEECQTLLQLATGAAFKNDGYKFQRGLELGTVHTEHELFSGITVDVAAQRASSSLTGIDSVRLYQRLAELSKEVVHDYFHLQTPLYFDYTHLVCRTAKNDSQVDRDDLSHPVHSDNCIIYSDGSCRKESPAYVERDYSAVLYLNDDFEGGEFVFTSPQPVAKDKWRVEAQVKPKCGRLVGFRAGDLHGVKAVLSGRRCAVAMWYTLDPYFREKAHLTARKTLDKAEQKLRDAMEKAENNENETESVNETNVEETVVNEESLPVENEEDSIDKEDVVRTLAHDGDSAGSK